MSPERLVVVVPAYDAEAHLRGVVERIRAAVPGARVVVVNDGSHDGTAAVADELMRACPDVQVLHRARNGGYGAAMKDGLQAAQRMGALWVACVHADGQYRPEELPRLLALLQNEELDVVQGSRIASGTALAGGMPLYKFVANRLLTQLGRWTMGLALSDLHSGYVLYGRRALQRIPFASLSNSFDFDVEVIAAARAMGLRIGEAAVPTHYGDEVSHLRPIPYGLRVLRALWRFRRGHYHRVARG